MSPTPQETITTVRDLWLGYCINSRDSTNLSKYTPFALSSRIDLKGLEFLLTTPLSEIPERDGETPIREMFREMQQKCRAQLAPLKEKAKQTYVESGTKQRAFLLLTREEIVKIEVSRILAQGAQVFLREQAQKKEQEAQLVRQQALLEQQRQLEHDQREAIYTSAASSLMIIAPSGWGKSRFIGFNVCLRHLQAGIGTVLIDPIGGSIDAFFAGLALLPADEQYELAPRIVYCDMAGMKIDGEIYVSSWPMLYRKSEDEELHTISQRYIDLIAKTEASFATASIQGLPRLVPLLTRISMVLAALGLPLSYALDMLDEPEEWKGHFKRLEDHPEAGRPVKRLQKFFFETHPNIQAQWSEPLRNRLSFLEDDRISRAMFSGESPTVDFDDAARNGKIVLLDFRRKLSGRSQEIRLHWVWNNLLEYIESRGTGSEYPFAVIIDELSYLTTGSHLNAEAIIADFQQFVQARRRNANIKFVGSVQELANLPEGMQRAVLQIPSQLYGTTTEIETAYKLGERYYEFDPTLVKAVERIGEWKEVSVKSQGGSGRWGKPRFRMQEEFVPGPGDPGEIKPTFMSLDEQRYLAALNFIKLEQGEWLFGKARGEEPAKSLEKVTALTPPTPKFKDADIASLRAWFHKRDGIVVTDSPKMVAAQTPPTPKVAKSSEPVSDSIAQASEAWEQIREEEKQPSHQGDLKGVLPGKSRKTKEPPTPGHDPSKSGTSKRFGRRE